MSVKDAVIEKMKEVFEKDEKRINHALKVLKFSEDIAYGEKLDQDMQKTTMLAAVLHDIGIPESEKKYNSSSAKYQEIEGPPIAEKILVEMGIDRSTIERVCYIVGGHHTKTKIDGIDFQIIWEADLIVNIEEGWIKATGKELEYMIDENFRTPTGVRIAQELYLK